MDKRTVIVKVEFPFTIFQKDVDDGVYGDAKTIEEALEAQRGFTGDGMSDIMDLIEDGDEIKWTMEFEKS